MALLRAATRTAQLSWSNNDPSLPVSLVGNITRCPQAGRNKKNREREGKRVKYRERRMSVQQKKKNHGGKKEKSLCVLEPYLFFFQPVTHVLLKGRSPDAERQLDGDGRAFCMRSSPYARGCWRAIGRE